MARTGSADETKGEEFPMDANSEIKKNNTLKKRISNQTEEEFSVSRQRFLQLLGAGTAGLMLSSGGLLQSCNGIRDDAGIRNDDSRRGPRLRAGEPGIRHDEYDGPIGGGEGMPSDKIWSADDADIVVTDGNLESAISQASSGDVIYVQGQATATSINQPGITIVGNRGGGNDSLINNADIDAENVMFKGLVVDMSGGISVNAPGFEAFNCEFYNGSDAGSMNFVLREPRATITQCLFHDITGPTIQTGAYQSGDDVTACGDSWNMTKFENRIIFEYCEWHTLGRHCISGSTSYLEVRDNYIHGEFRIQSNDHFIQLRAPNACRIEGSGSVNDCGTPCGTALVDHNYIEATGTSGRHTRLAAVRGTPYQDPAYFRNNYAPYNAPPEFGCEASGEWETVWDDQIVLQNAGGAGWGNPDNVILEGNEYNSRR